MPKSRCFANPRCHDQHPSSWRALPSSECSEPAHVSSLHPVASTSSSSLHIRFNRQKSPYQLMTRFGSEELVRYEGSLNRSSAWACEAVAGVERAIRALLSPPWRPCTARAAFNLATTRRCCVAVRAIVKPYVLGRTRKTQGSTRTFWPGILVSLRMCHIGR